MGKTDRVLVLLALISAAACGEVPAPTSVDAAETPIDAGDDPIDAASGVDASEATCTDSVQNGNETGRDCGGGTCDPCPDNVGCEVPTDCQSGVCTNLFCAAATCVDGVRNADESDIDCAGHCGAGSCDLLQVCNGDGTVCSSGECASNRCAGTYGYSGATQTVTIPAGVTSLTIDAYGASGGGNSVRVPGAGAFVRGTFTVTPGDVLTLAIGGVGSNAVNSPDSGAGGGGGTGVMNGASLMLIAAGGGGAGYQTDGGSGNIGPDGAAGFSAFYPGGAGGVAGADGANNSQNSSAGGRGWNGGAPTPGLPMTHGGGWGFGGGGGGSGTNGHGGGGGGGYSGGGGAWDGGGGGGGSINNGSNQASASNANNGNGWIRIAP